MKNTIISFVTFFALCVFIIQFVGCGPSKMEVEEHEKRGEVWNHGKWVKVASNPYETETQEEPQPPTSSEEIGYDDIEIRVIDSCEYIVWGKIGNSSGNIIHKANCRNPIHNK